MNPCLSLTCREQKTIDIENRAHYLALRERWKVLDATITFPDDDLVQSPPYMELSDGEEDSNCSPLHTKSGGRSGPSSQAGLNNSKTVSGNPGTACDGSGCVSTLDSQSFSNGFKPSPRHPHLSNPSATTDSLSPSAATETENRDRTSSAPCTITTTTTTSASTADGDLSECSCDFRKKSYEDVLDEEGRALLQILEFPARVHATRQAVDLEKSYPKAKRIILRDVLRTDRNFHYFRYSICLSSKLLEVHV